MQDVIREAPALIDLLIRHSSDRLVIFDLEGVIIELNEVAARSLDGTRDELRGRLYFDLFPPVLAERYEEMFARGVQGEKIDCRCFCRGVRWNCHLRRIALPGGKDCLLSVATVATDPLPLSDTAELAKSEEAREQLLGDLAPLSERELHVALLIGSGATDQKVAEVLHRSVRTVHAHRRSIGAKLKIESRASLQTMVRERGLTLDITEVKEGSLL